VLIDIDSSGAEKVVARSCNRLFALWWRSMGSAGEPDSFATGFIRGVAYGAPIGFRAVITFGAL
jgi:hypothetical protein